MKYMQLSTCVLIAVLATVLATSAQSAVIVLGPGYGDLSTTLNSGLNPGDEVHLDPSLGSGLPGMWHEVNASMTIPAGVTVKGLGASPADVLIVRRSNIQVMSGGGDGVVLENVTLLRAGDNSGNASGIEIFANMARATMTNVVFDGQHYLFPSLPGTLTASGAGSVGDGVNMLGSTMNGCVVKNMANKGVLCAADPFVADEIITDTDIFDNGSDGIRIQGYWPSAISIDGCDISGNGGDGVFLEYHTNSGASGYQREVYIDGTTISLNGGSGVHSNFSPPGLTLSTKLIQIASGSSITGNGGSGIDVTKIGDELTVTGSTILDNDVHGVLVTYTTANQIGTDASGNTIEDNGLNGVQLFEAASTQVVNNDINGNGLDGSPPYDSNGIFSNVAWSSIIRGNRLFGNGAYNVHVRKSHNDPTVIDNTISGGTTRGVWMDESSAVLQDNHISGSGIGVYFTDGTYVSSGNVIFNNSNTGIYTSDFTGSPPTTLMCTNETIWNNSESGVLSSGVAGSAIDIQDSIIVGNAVAGLNGSGRPLTSDYNDVFDNGSDYDGLTAGANDVSVDPVFTSVDPASACFLFLTGCTVGGTPASVLTGSSDGSFRGAMPACATQSCTCCGDFANQFMEDICNALTVAQPTSLQEFDQRTAAVVATLVAGENQCGDANECITHLIGLLP